MKLGLANSLSLHFLVLFLAQYLPPSHQLCEFPAIFAFGASCIDTGGFSAAFEPLPPPYGMTFFGSPAGRYSDGRHVLDFIAQSFGLPFIDPYLDSVGTNFSHGANFATGSSTILPPQVPVTVKNGNSPFYFMRQVNQFVQFKERSTKISKKGKFTSTLPKEEFFSQALYVIEIGQNDLGKIISKKISPQVYIPKAMQQFSKSISTLYEAGARYFWIHNAGPAGCLPYLLVKMPPEKSELDSAGCSVYFNEINQEFNRQLNDTVTVLRNTLSDATLILVDIYSAKYSVIDQATCFGFKKTLRSCCGYGDNEWNFNWEVRCGYPDVVGGVERIPTACGDPSEYLVWDGIHYTDAAYKVIFDKISGGNYSDPPLGLKMACQGNNLQEM